MIPLHTSARTVIPEFAAHFRSLAQAGLNCMKLQNQHDLQMNHLQISVWCQEDDTLATSIQLEPHAVEKQVAYPHITFSIALRRHDKDDNSRLGHRQ